MTAANANLTLENLTLTNARTTAGRIANDCSSSSGQGGAVCALGELTLINSTLSGNTAGGNGGGASGDGALTLTNSTVAGNTAAATGGGVYGHDTMSLTSSILASNTTGGSPDDCGMSSGSATASTSLIQATGACGVTEGQNGNLIGQDPLLAALADTTPSAGDGTCVLTTGSPVIDAGSNPNHLTTDQRGRPRVQDAAVDMGTFESTQLGLTVTGGGKGEGTVTGNGLSCMLTAGTPSGLRTATLVEGSAVSATAAATTGSSFSGWTDATCQGTTNPCSFNLSAATTLTAAVGKSQYDLTVTGGGSGSGTVTGNGLSCTLTTGTPSGLCAVALDYGTDVSLTATATAGIFSGWSEASCGTASPCTFTITDTKRLTATFRLLPSSPPPPVTPPDTPPDTASYRANIQCSDDAKLWIYRAYRGYYGRCAECGGFHYWFEHLDAEGGGSDLGPIIAAFGTSEEYTKRFSGLSDVELIHNLYLNMFDRRAERGGLAFYLALLETYRQEWRDRHDGDDQGATKFGLSHIALDILLGAQGNDVSILDGKLGACKQF